MDGLYFFVSDSAVDVVVYMKLLRISKLYIPNASLLLLIFTGFCFLTGCQTTSTVWQTRSAKRGESSSLYYRSSKQAEEYGQQHIVVVRPQETVYAIARQKHVLPEQIIAWNHLQNPNHLYPGQRLILYPKTPIPAYRSNLSSVTTTSAPAAVNPYTPSEQRASKDTSSQPALSKPVDTSVPIWYWPTKGTVLSSFQPGDTTRQGIDIAGKNGQAVRSAADGVVVYSGSGLIGYGELIIIKHNAHWLSAYGHNRARLVHEGEHVKANQQIAELGSTGAQRDMLHFEIRYDGKPVNPLLYLPAPVH